MINDFLGLRTKKNYEYGGQSIKSWPLFLVDVTTRSIDVSGITTLQREN